jgi:hypothetical protein
MTTVQKIIRAKLGLLELAKQFRNVSQACTMMDYSRDAGWDDGFLLAMLWQSVHLYRRIEPPRRSLPERKRHSLCRILNTPNERGMSRF